MVREWRGARDSGLPPSETESIRPTSIETVLIYCLLRGRLMQRQPQLPQKDPPRSIPLSALIDTLVLFLRHNLRKRLDVETYT